MVANVPAEEVKLQQDLNSDGYVGIAPPASLAGKAYQFSLGGGYTWTVPLELVFGSTTYDEGFAGSLLDADQPYTYANGVVTTDGGDEIRLTFTSATSGSFEYWELDDVGFYLEDVGTFNEVTPSLVLKNDWQRTETIDSPLSTNYWNIWRRTVDSVAYNAGELNFLFADGADVGEPGGDYPEIELEYGRTLPMDANWQIVLDDAYAASRLNGFELELDLELENSEFEFEFDFAFADYGSDGAAGTREVNVWLERQNASGFWESVSAYVSANEDLRIQDNVSLRVLHTANSRELRFQYQPGDASAWTELARLNLETGAFTSSYYSYGEGFSGQLFSSSERLSLEVDAESGQATNLGDLKIGGIEIGSYTPLDPPASIEGLQFEYQPSGLETSSVPWQELYGSDGYAQFGFSGSVIERIPYTYAQGVVTYTIFDEEIRLSFETATSGTYEYVEIDGADLFVDEVGTFSIVVAPTLEVKTDDWQRSETMDSPLSTDYWNIARRTVDKVDYNAGELSFIFANGGEPGEDDYPEIQIEYGRTLPLDENWQVVLDDLFASPSVSNFRIGFDLSFLDSDTEVDCYFNYDSNAIGGRQLNAVVERRGDTYVYRAGAFVSANQDARLQGGVNLRVRHNAASRDLLFEYQPDGASGWTELARLNLGDGTFAGTNQYGDGVAPY